MNKQPNLPFLTISAAAKLVGISIHTIRMYEREGLILPYKEEGKQRRYSANDVERMRCIRQIINDEKMSIEGIRRMLALIPCWAITGCKTKDQKNCEFFSSYTKPCWMINHKNNFCTDKECRECDVYYSFGNCKSIKEKLKELLSS